MMMLQTFLCMVCMVLLFTTSFYTSRMLMAKLGSERGNPPRRIATLLLGANLKKLKQSMDERVDKAFETMTKNHPDDQHIYFATGHREEAEYIEKALQGKYWTAKLTQPEIVIEDKAQFTVDNFMKTIPLINRCIADYGNIEKCYLVTSCYHMDRAWAILEEFRNLDLANRCRFERCEAPYDFRKNGDVKFLEPRIDQLRDPARDRSNAEIFAKLCKMEMNDPNSLSETQVKALCQRYAINNNVKFDRYGPVDTDNIVEFNKKMDQMDKMISLFKEGHGFPEKCTLASTYKIDVSTKGEAVMNPEDSKLRIKLTKDCMVRMQKLVGCVSPVA